MNVSSAEMRELLSLLHVMREGNLQATEGHRLSQLVIDGQDERQLFVRYMLLSATLRWSRGGFNAQHVDVPTCLPVLVSPAPIIPSSATNSPIRRSGTFWLPLVLTTFAVAAIFYGLFVGIAWNLRPTASPSHSQMATLTASEKCQWSGIERAPTLGAEVPSGPVKLTTGVAELTFSGGAHVVIEGPAEFEVRSASSGFLRKGKLVASVPPRAIGFTIETSATKIVDLGTEFGVEVNDNGVTDVQVFEGKIVLEHSTRRDRAGYSEQQVLVAGMARKVESAAKDGSVTVRAAEWNPARFVRNLGTPGSRPLAVAGAMASSSAQWNVNNLINDSGLVGNAHSCHSQTEDRATGTMWHTALGRVKDEYVLFDLGNSRRVHSLKVWNYNETSDGLFAYRGVKRADIYVSFSGRGNPLSHPDAWRRVGANKIFSPAPGVDSYDTPDVIELSGVEARFVGIVIRECLGSDPRPQYTGKSDAVGLSEVQFFGELLYQPSPK